VGLSTSDTRIWAGIDAGKGPHWAVAVDADGETLFSTKVINDEAQILTLIHTARERADEVRWAVDISGRASTLLLALLIAHGQQVVYVPGRTVNRMTGAYRGEGKTDARDARVIADQARMRRDFAPLDTPPELVSNLRVLTNYRADLIADRVRLINRLRDLLVGICPALERAFDYSAAKGPVVMLTEYQTPAALRRIGVKRLTACRGQGRRGRPVPADRAAGREAGGEAGLRPRPPASGPGRADQGQRPGDP
jgi:transposase